MRRYEGMFLFDNTNVHQWSEMEAEVHRLCNRIGANLHVCLKFDERKLAYDIKGRKRGTYVLTYFDADPLRIGELERDARLSEVLLRSLVLRADLISEERLAELKARPADQPLQPISSEGRRGDGFRGRDRQEFASETSEREQSSPAEDSAEAQSESETEEATETDTERADNGRAPSRKPPED